MMRRIVGNDAVKKFLKENGDRLRSAKLPVRLECEGTEDERTGIIESFGGGEIHLRTDSGSCVLHPVRDVRAMEVREDPARVDDEYRKLCATLGAHRLGIRPD